MGTPFRAPTVGFALVSCVLFALFLPISYAADSYKPKHEWTADSALAMGMHFTSMPLAERKPGTAISQVSAVPPLTTAEAFGGKDDSLSDAVRLPEIKQAPPLGWGPKTQGFGSLPPNIRYRPDPPAIPEFRKPTFGPSSDAIVVDRVVRNFPHLQMVETTNNMIGLVGIPASAKVPETMGPLDSSPITQRLMENFSGNVRIIVKKSGEFTLLRFDPPTQVKGIPDDLYVSRDAFANINWKPMSQDQAMDYLHRSLVVQSCSGGQDTSFERVFEATSGLTWNQNLAKLGTDYHNDRLSVLIKQPPTTPVDFEGIHSNLGSVLTGKLQIPKTNLDRAFENERIATDQFRQMYPSPGLTAPTTRNSASQLITPSSVANIGGTHNFTSSTIPNPPNLLLSIGSVQSLSSPNSLNNMAGLRGLNSLNSMSNLNSLNNFGRLSGTNSLTSYGSLNSRGTFNSKNSLTNSTKINNSTSGINSRSNIGSTGSGLKR